MGSKRRMNGRPLRAAIGMLMAAAIALALMLLPDFANAAQDDNASGTAGDPKHLMAIPPAGGYESALMGAQDGGQLYAVFDSSDGSLTFKREAGTYTDGQEVGALTYYTGAEDIDYAVNNRPSWLAKAGQIKEVNFQTAVAPKSCICWFDRCRNLEKVLNVDKLDLSGVTSMRLMFEGCHKLSFLDVSKWNTSKVVDMLAMFRDCFSLADLDVSKWNTSEATNMSSMFDGCNKLTYLDVSKWNTSKVVDMLAMFRDCSSLPNLDVSKWNTSEATDMGGMFAGCRNLASLDVSKWDTSKVEDMGGMFATCSNLASLDVSGWDTSKVEGMGSMFNYCSLLTSLDVSGWDTSKVESMADMFNGCAELTSLDVSGWDTSRVVKMDRMFFNCSALDFLDLSGWNTSNATHMSNMFRGCTSLSSVRLGRDFSFSTPDPDLSAELPSAPDDEPCTGKWINESMTGASGVTPEELKKNYTRAGDPSFSPGTYAWEGTTKVAVFDSNGGSLTFKRVAGAYSDGQVDGTKTYYTGFEDKDYSYNEQPSWLAHASNIKKVDFQATVAPRSCACWFDGCMNLEEVLSANKLTTSGATNMGDMFYGCSSLASLDVSKWNTSSVTDMIGMFVGCSSLASLDVSRWDTSKVKGMGNMFNYCSSLTSLDVSGWDTSKVGGMPNMFFGCSSLSSVKLGGSFSFKGAASDPMLYAVLPDAPDSSGYTGKWVNSSDPSAQGVAAADLRDDYPSAADPSYAPGTYVWEPDIAIAIVSAANQVYDGTKKTPAPTVTWNGKTLAAETDYDISYKNNVNVGTATVTVTGKGIYEGSSSGTFKINPASISKAKVTLASTSYVYDGKAKKPAVKSVVLNGKKLKAGTDYTVGYKNNVKLGTATVTVTGRGNYKDSTKATFKIVLAKPKLTTIGFVSRPSVNASWSKVAGATSYQLQHRLAGGKWATVATKGISRTVTGLKAGGLYQLRVRAVAGKQAGDWSGVSYRYLGTVSGLKATAKAGTATATWKADPKANAGYTVLVRYAKNGAVVARADVAKGKTKAIVKGLEKSERYWVQVCPKRASGGATYSGVLRGTWATR